MKIKTKYIYSAVYLAGEVNRIKVIATDEENEELIKQYLLEEFGIEEDALHLTKIDNTILHYLPEVKLYNTTPEQKENIEDHANDKISSLGTGGVEQSMTKHLKETEEYIQRDLHHAFDWSEHYRFWNRVFIKAKEIINQRKKSKKK